MAEQTANLKLIKPTDGEAADQDDFNANFDTLDRHPGTLLCTTTTRPAAPFEGQHIYETNTGRRFVRRSGAWRLVSWPHEEEFAEGTVSNSQWYSTLSIMRTGAKTGLLSGYVRRSASTALSVTADAGYTGFNLSPASAFSGTNIWAKPTGLNYAGTNPVQVPAVISGSGLNTLIQLSVSHDAIMYRAQSSFSWPGSNVVYAWFAGIPVKIQGE